MRSLLPVCLVLASLPFFASCGGGSTDDDGEVGGATPAYTLQWVGTVTEVLDADDSGAQIDGVSFFDTFVGRMDFDPGEFGNHISLSLSEGQYVAAPGHARTVLEFSGGAVVERDVAFVQVRDDAPWDRIAVRSPDGSTPFVIRDASESVFPPRPTVFANLIDLVIDQQPLFDGLEMVIYFRGAVPEDDKRILASIEGFSINEN